VDRLDGGKAVLFVPDPLVLFLVCALARNRMHRCFPEMMSHYISFHLFEVEKNCSIFLECNKTSDYS
jgi:hypothetical protein